MVLAAMAAITRSRVGLQRQMAKILRLLMVVAVVAAVLGWVVTAVLDLGSLPMTTTTPQVRRVQVAVQVQVAH